MQTEKSLRFYFYFFLSWIYAFFVSLYHNAFFSVCKERCMFSGNGGCCCWWQTEWMFAHWTHFFTLQFWTIFYEFGFSFSFIQMHFIFFSFYFLLDAQDCDSERKRWIASSLTVWFFVFDKINVIESEKMYYILQLYCGLYEPRWTD